MNVGLPGLSLLALLAVPLNAQNQTAQSPAVVQGRPLYDRHCAGCHGVEAQGTARAPELSRNRKLRGRSLGELQDLIHNGIPAGGMPAFDLPDTQLAALAAFVHSLNAPAAEIAAPGDRVAGERFFFNRGLCASCHMVKGQGRPIGPDLSNVGRQMTLQDLRESLLQPSAHIAAGYQLVTVSLRDGKTLRGFVKNRSNFDLLLQDLDGRMQTLPKEQISAIQDEKQSLMMPVQANPGELQNLVAYLSGLTGVTPGAMVTPTVPTQPEEVTFERIVQPKPGDWLSYDGKLTGHRYSDLNQINTTNVNRLVVKWVSPIPHFGLEVTPLVADGIMYVAGPNQAYAFDASTGRKIWTYSRPRTPGLVGDASLGTNRGLALLGDKVFMVTDNAHLLALNRHSGSLVWDQVMPEEPQHYGSTVAPLIVKDLVIAGVSGADWGIRGFLAAYKASTGERAWRHWTIPAKGEPGYETWKGADPKYGGGGTWLTGSYDAETETLFWPTATPWPVSDDRQRGGDNLYTDCILALNPDTGKLKWHYQYTPHDVHAWDATEPHAIVDTNYRGKPRKLLLHADRNGFFYVFDRTNGELLLARNFVKVTWASGIGPDGRPQLTPLASGETSCPGADPSNWDATAFSPVTRLYYVMALEQCVPTGPRKSLVAADPGQKYLRALDIETGKVVWEKPQIGTTASKHWAGVLDTAGGVLFFGDPNGDFVAVDERNGDSLWHFPTNEVIKASPITYLVNGKQFIALAVGSNIMTFGLP